MAMSHRLAWRRCALLGDQGSVRGCAYPALSRPAPLGVIQLSRQLGQSKTIKPGKANPPESTLPPPLEVASRDECESKMHYLIQLGKGYVRFYKNGIKAIWTNRKLLRKKLDRMPGSERPSILFPPWDVPATFTRADWVLLWRVRHDLMRLPIFGLMLLIIGEFTALVVIYVDRVVPYTCRIPKQARNAVERSENRRRDAFRQLQVRYRNGALSPDMTPAVARRHILRSLDIAGNMWDRLGFIPPGMWQVKGQSRMKFLEGDDQCLVDEGDSLELSAVELSTACRERGIDTLGKKDSELKALLSQWLRLTRADNPAERRRRMAVLMLTRPEEWPQKRDFTVPDWEL
ncbi:LETM1-like protein [Ophiocordyceps camponoti-floridani]|uniref:LETM1-like protein n=1 Tax=Ophiocordyceps camponoti-floridani TaxID=2030778 RepID=A0A8H4VF69_9HYPO|nr:LETM1-like protein [Ophiocordyceps camponoti-floridani]